MVCEVCITVFVDRVVSFAELFVVMVVVVDVVVILVVVVINVVNMGGV